VILVLTPNVDIQTDGLIGLKNLTDITEKDEYLEGYKYEKIIEEALVFRICEIADNVNTASTSAVKVLGNISTFSSQVLESQLFE